MVYIPQPTTVCYTHTRMNIPQKILILSCSAGLGHVRAGEALKVYAEQNFSKHLVIHHNISTLEKTFFRTAISSTYDQLITRAPKIFGAIYRFTDTDFGCSVAKTSMVLLRNSSRQLHNLINTLQPDRIIATHFLIPYLLENYTSLCPIDVVVTDYYTNKIWLGPNIRTLYVPTQETFDQLHSKHPNSVVSGIPLDPSFYATRPTPPTDPATKKQSILILSGGKGYINTVDITKKILASVKNTTVVAVAGTNKELLRELRAITNTGSNDYQPEGFSHNMAGLMANATCIVTKPGGLTVSEALYLKKPLILLPPSPGQEQYNERFVLEHNYGISAKNTDTTTEQLSQVLLGKILLTTPPTTPIPQTIIFNDL